MPTRAIISYIFTVQHALMCLLNAFRLLDRTTFVQLGTETATVLALG